MIATQYINSTTSVPKSYKDFEIINVLKWNGRWRNFSPYFLKTDGREECVNQGGVLFENFWQGTKVYDVVYENDVYPSRFQQGDPKYLWWSFRPLNKEGDVIYKDEKLNYELYLRWRESIWSCPKPIRYPNKIFRRKNTQFALCIDKDGGETRMDYVTARKQIYMKEYIRLVKNLEDYNRLLNKLKDGKNLMICEVDVPSSRKKNNFSCESNICLIDRNKLELLMNDTSEAFGHGLCLSYSLLKDLS